MTVIWYSPVSVFMHFLHRPTGGAGLNTTLQSERQRQWEGERERGRGWESFPGSLLYSFLFPGSLVMMIMMMIMMMKMNNHNDLILESGCSPCCPAFEVHPQINKDWRFSQSPVCVNYIISKCLGNAFMRIIPVPLWIALIQIICNL